MTQTPHEDTVRIQDETSNASDRGLRVERVFSTDGVHPYDEVEWERRDVVQSNWKTGETVFEQRGVEFPVDCLLAQRVEDTIRQSGQAEVPSGEVGLAILAPLRDLDEVAYLRFVSVYRGFSSLSDFEKEITFLREDHAADM